MKAAHLCTVLILVGCSRDVDLGDRPRVVGGIHISGGTTGEDTLLGSGGMTAQTYGGTPTVLGGGRGDCNSDSLALATDLHGNIRGLCGRVHGAWFLRAGNAQVYPLIPRVSVVGAVELCASGTPEAVALHDISLGFDFVRSNEQAFPFNAATEGLRGIAFEIDPMPAASLRVEFEDVHGVVQTPDDLSPVKVGVNEVTWRAVPELDPEHLLSVVFQVPAGATASPVQFCVRNVRLLR